MPLKIVEVARNENHPLHGEFEWDDEKSAHEHRLLQARNLIVKVKIIYEDRTVQAFHNVRIVEEDGSRSQAYYPIEIILSNEDKRRQLMEGAMREIDYWREKYETISELSSIVNKDELTKVRKNIK